jgi:hypothetical protein
VLLKCAPTVRVREQSDERNTPRPVGHFPSGNTPPQIGGFRVLKDVEPLVDMITLTIYTAYIKNVPKPNSLLIVARPESGKTEAMKKFVVNKNIAYLSDATAFGIERDYLSKIESGEIRHIIMPDLLKPLSRKESTVKTFITMMNGLIEEGIASVATYATRRITEEHVKCGIITAITDSELRDQRHNWGRIGFLSRIVPFSYSYGIESVKKIFDHILGLDYLSESNIELKGIPRQDKEIRLPLRYAQAILPSTTTIAQAQHAYGFRLQKQFQALLQASALESSRPAVISTDVERVLHLMNWVNFDENPIASRRPKK